MFLFSNIFICIIVVFTTIFLCYNNNEVDNMKSKVDDGYIHNTFLYKLLKPLLVFIVWFLYNPKIIGKENIRDGGCVIASNHVHAFDPIIIMYSTKRVVHYLAKIELYKGILKYFFLSYGTIPVDRSKHNPLALDLAIEYLKNGEVIGIFPEGTRNKTNDILLPFKFGAVKMASKANKKIIPCAIIGKYKIFRRSLTIKYGEAIDVSGMEIEEANLLLRNKIIKLLEDK